MFEQRERGFTLVELMVVVMIIAILIAIGVVTLLGVRRSAQDRAAQSLARETLASAKTIFSVDENYQDATVAALRASEPTLRFLEADEASQGPEEVSVDAPDDVTFIAAVLSNSGTCFYIRDRASPVVPVGERGTTYGAKTSGPCAANAPPATFSGRW